MEGKQDLIRLMLTEPEDFSPKALKLLKSVSHVSLLEKPSELFERLQTSDAIMVRLGYQWNKELLEKAPALRYILTPTTGLDHIDINFTQSKNIRIISLFGEKKFLNNIPSTAEHTFALLLSLLRKIPFAFQHVLELGWDRQKYRGYNLKDKNLGILGMGRVGFQVANFARAFGMKVITYDPDSLYVEPWMKNVASAEKVFSEADIVSIHIPLNEKNINFVNTRLLSLMKKNAYLINTSRGGVWDEDAVADAVETGQIAGVATDVLQNELDYSKRNYSRLLSLAQKGYPIIITPHIAGATFESMHLTEDFIAEKWINEISTHSLNVRD